MPGVGYVLFDESMSEIHWYWFSVCAVFNFFLIVVKHAQRLTILIF